MRIHQDPYADATFVSKLRKSGVIIASDFDGTQTSGAEVPSASEFADRARGLAIAHQMGAVTLAVTARTLGLTMSQRLYDSSVAKGFEELPPHWHKNPVTGKYEYIDLAEVLFFADNLDWDISAGFGSGIAVKNGDAYLVDTVYETLLRNDWSKAQPDPEPVPWRLAALMFISAYCPDVRRFMSHNEFVDHYHKGDANVAPLNYRIQFNFGGSHGYGKMLELKSIVEQKRHEGDPLALRLQMVDESKLHEDPEKCMYVLYWVPWQGRKENMINRVLVQAAQAAGRNVESVRLFYAGDTLTDLYAGLWGGDTQTTFLLATGSRLAPYLIERRGSYGAEDLSRLWANPQKGRKDHRLMPTGEKGVYKFVHKIRGGRVNTVVIGDEKYPECTPPGSVAQFLDEFLVHRSNTASA